MQRAIPQVAFPRLDAALSRSLTFSSPSHTSRTPYTLPPSGGIEEGAAVEPLAAASGARIDAAESAAEYDTDGRRLTAVT